MSARLYYLKGDFRVPRIVSMLALAEIDCEFISITDHDLDTLSELQRLSPLGLTPIFKHNESTVLFKVPSILRYLARLHKEKGLAGLLPKEEALVDQWVDLCCEQLDPLIQRSIEELGAGYPNSSRAEAYLREIAKILSVLEARFSQDYRFFVGYGPTLADVALASTLTVGFWQIFKDYFSLGFPHTTRWLKDCKQRFDFASVKCNSPRFLPNWRERE